jgi:dipeptidyl aminopeptidase/acylaminoacyl peptidase
MSELRRAPFGSWESSIPIDALVAGVVRLGEPSVDGSDIYWLEGRPADAGRSALVRLAPDGSTTDVSPGGVNVRTRVHEYGGGAYVVDDGVVWFSNFADGRLYRRDRDGIVTAITPDGSYRYADPGVDRARGRLICVREDHAGPGEAVNSIVAVPLDGQGGVRTLLQGSDFYSDPRLSPDGSRLAWLSWEHPNMPWDETSLWVGSVASDGSIASRERIAGEPGESVLQPRWSPDGVLHFVAERSGWWNIYRRVDGRDEPVAPMEAEFASPQWLFRFSNYAFLEGGAIVGSGRHDGRDELFVIDAATRTGRLVPLPYTEIDHVTVAEDGVLFVGSGPTAFRAVVRLDLRDGSSTVLRRSTSIVLDPGDVSAGQPIEFPTAGGRTAHGIFYPPRHGNVTGPGGELPPLVVTSHGGPTAAASTGLSIETQLFTSRGIAVLDVDYGGSTGYGRAYRKRLEGTWGLTDVEDCANGALALVARGLVDPARLAIRGGSASGYTTLCALTFRSEFRAGICYFGIGDLETFAHTTHKFESRYLETLIGPYPQRRDLYVDRSPLNFTDRSSTPALILQGLDDRVVPPAQAEQIVAGFRRAGVPHAYLAFEGEDHGFRQAANIIRSFEAELSFLGQVLGFEPAGGIVPLPVENLDAWRAARGA